MKAMAPNREDRYAGAADLSFGIGGFLEGQKRLHPAVAAACDEPEGM